jgi:hypothetical protein
MKKYLQVSSGLTTFAIATIFMRSTPHKQRARIYVQARPTIFLMLWAYFFAHNCRIVTEGMRPLFMRSTPHSVEMQTDRIRRFAFHVFYCPLWRKAWML